MNRLLALTITVGLAITGLAIAQFPQDPNANPNANLENDDQNREDQSRGVARISVINGDVSVRRGDSGEVVAAALNAPIVVQDHVMTNEGSRAEVQFDSSNMIRMSPMAEIRFSELEYNRYQIQIARGTVTFRVLRDHTADVELSTPTVSVRPVNRGSYRVTVRDDGTTEITVRSGDADIFTPRGSERLSAGRTMLARGTPAEPEVQVVGAIRLDEWDQWNERRDRDLERSESNQYVSRDIYGAEDLDGNGRWVADAEYGNVWSPYATAGWAPYRNGRWVWVDYYGWSWVSYDSWGWAPYHYGSWFYRSTFGWCWYPGERHGHHYWSPARVAFFGFGGRGGGVNVGIGFGNVGWVPLGPREPYYRGYGRGVYGGYRNGGYADRSINIQNNVNITNIYRNARVHNGITAIDQNHFGRGRVGNNVRVSSDDLNRASLVRGQLPVAPGRESLRMSDRDARNVRPGIDNGRFSSRRQPTQVDRIPFEEQRRGMEQASRRTFGETIPARGSAAVDQPGRGSNRGEFSGGNSGGWRRFGEPVRSQSGDRSNAEGGRGWRNLGEAPASRGNMETQRSETGGYQRQDRNRSSEQRFQTPPAESPRMEIPRQESPRMDSPRTRGDGGGFGRGGSIRISPPIVRERAPERTPERTMEQRSAPRSEGRGNMERSAPRSEPRSEPRNNGGGGGGRNESRSGGSRGESNGARGGRGR
jgi:hypothetical protein